MAVISESHNKCPAGPTFDGKPPRRTDQFGSYGPPRWCRCASAQPADGHAARYLNPIIMTATLGLNFGMERIVFLWLALHRV
jgi:hypothetical protein